MNQVTSLNLSNSDWKCIERRTYQDLVKLPHIASHINSQWCSINVRLRAVDGQAIDRQSTASKN